MAVIGAGYIGRLHIAHLVVNPEVKLAGFAEPDTDRRDSVAAEFGISAFQSADALLDQLSVDAAIICVPPHARNGVEVEFARRHIPLLVEKPIAVALDTGEQLATVLSQSGIPVVYGYQWRQLSCLPTVRELVAGRTINVAIGHWLSSTPAADWWGNATTAGSTFVEQATHLIDFAQLLMGPVTAVAASSSATRIRADPDSFACASGATVTFDSGSVGSFVTACTAPDSYRRSLDILLDGFALSITEDGCTVTRNNSVISLPHEGPGLYEREQRAFLDLVRNGRPSPQARPPG